MNRQPAPEAFTIQRTRQQAEAERIRRERLEDLEDMANWGVPFDEAARRIDMNPESLHRYLGKHDRALSRRLVQNSIRRGLTRQGTLVDHWSNGD